DAGDEAAPFAEMMSALRPVFGEVFAPVPPLLRHLDDAILAVAEVFPIGLDIDCFGITAAQADDGDRIIIRRRARRALAPAIGTPPLGHRWRDLRRSRHRGTGPEDFVQLRRMMSDEISGQLTDGLIFEEERLGQGAERL